LANIYFTKKVTKRQYLIGIATASIFCLGNTGCSLLPVSCRPELTFDASRLEEIKRYKNCEATVTGFVYSNSYGGKVLFLNIGSSDYRQAFTGVIFKSSFDQFSQSGIDPRKKYNRKLISVTGTIQEYKGNPQIIINSPTQIYTHPKSSRY
jgi:hypothetical protein